MGRWLGEGAGAKGWGNWLGHVVGASGWDEGLGTSGSDMWLRWGRCLRKWPRRLFGGRDERRGRNVEGGWLGDPVCLH